MADSGTGIVGLWAMGSATELKTQHFAFFANGRVMMIDPLGETEVGACLNARQGPAGGEFASYTYNAATGALRWFAKQYDTNGCAGLFDSTAGETERSRKWVIAADGKTATLSGGDEVLTFYRIAVK